jgi:hypothetical protein
MKYSVLTLLSLITAIGVYTCVLLHANGLVAVGMRGVLVLSLAVPAALSVRPHRAHYIAFAVGACAWYALPWNTFYEDFLPATLWSMIARSQDGTQATMAIWNSRYSQDFVPNPLYFKEVWDMGTAIVFGFLAVATTCCIEWLNSRTLKRLS